MKPDVSTGGQLDWLPGDLVRPVAAISRAVILCYDGIALGAAFSGRD